MERYIGLDAHASSCTLGIVGPSGKRLGSHVVETNGRALIEVLRGIPRNRHVCIEEGTLSGWLYEVLEPHVEELVVTGVHQSRGPKSDGHRREALVGRVRAGGAAADRLARDAGLQGARQGRAAGPRGAGVRVRGARRRAGEEPAEERAALAGRGLRSGEFRVREGGPGAMARRAARGDAAVGGAPVRGARRARGPEGAPHRRESKGVLVAIAGWGSRGPGRRGRRATARGRWERRGQLNCSASRASTCTG
jgi:hypothetical protein